MNRTWFVIPGSVIYGMGLLGLCADHSVCVSEQICSY